MLLVAAATPAAARGQSTVDTGRTLTPLAAGVTYETFERIVGMERVRVYVLRAELSEPTVTSDLLYPGVVAKRELLSETARRTGAVAGVNGDFFDIEKSDAPLGTAIAAGELLKSPDEFVKLAGVGMDGVGRLRDSGLAGTLGLPSGSRVLHGLNRFKLFRDQIGLYTPRWGTYRRARTVDDSSTVHTVVVREGRVSDSIAGTREGEIPADGFELVGREQGAAELASLAVGDAVSASYEATFSSPVASPFRFAIGGVSYLVRDGAVTDNGAQDGVDRPVYPRTGIGFSASGRTMILVLVDGRQATSSGLGRTRDFAQLMKDSGAHEALHLDGGGSATMVVRRPGESRPRVANNPSDGAEATGLPGTEREVPNGVGIFSSAPRTEAPGADQAPPVTGAMAPRGPQARPRRLLISRRARRARRGGLVAVAVGCRSEAPCRGTLRLRAAYRPPAGGPVRRAEIARAGFELAPGTRRHLAVRLSDRGRSLVDSRRAIRVLVLGRLDADPGQVSGPTATASFRLVRTSGASRPRR